MMDVVKNREASASEISPWRFPMRLQRIVAATALVAVGTLVWRWRTDAQKQKTPFVPIPDTVSATARKFLESLPDPAGLPALPAPDDLKAWKQVWQAGETANEPKVQATLKRYDPTVKNRRLGAVP